MTPEEILSRRDHRPWPLPSGPWLMRQRWNRLLFAHWPVSPQDLRPLVPSFLDLDVCDGRCWIAVTPFFLSGLSFRRLPLVPATSFPELNVRTYVRYEGKPGVYFFSLDAGSALAVFGARAMYGLPYFYAHMRIRLNEEAGTVRYHCLRRYRGRHARFEGEYGPSGPEFRAAEGSLEHFLTERYCLYAVEGRRLYRGEIHHVPWPLHVAESDILVNTMAGAAGITLPDDRPLLHFAPVLDVLVWGPERLR